MRPTSLCQWRSRSADGVDRVLAACDYSHREFARRAGHSGRPSLAEDAEEQVLPTSSWPLVAGYAALVPPASEPVRRRGCWEDPGRRRASSGPAARTVASRWLHYSTYGGEEYGGGIPNYIIDKARPRLRGGKTRSRRHLLRHRHGGRTRWLCISHGAATQPWR